MMLKQSDFVTVTTHYFQPKCSGNQTNQFNGFHADLCLQKFLF